MRTEFSRRRRIFLASYGQNAVVHLIIAIGVAYILLHAVKLIFMVLADDPKLVLDQQILPAVALQPFSSFIKHPWVLLTYFWGHISFFNMLSNMLWLYCFGSVIQTFVGSKEIIPLFVISGIGSGLLFVAISLLWSDMPTNSYLITTLPCVLAFAVAAIVLVPRYRFYLGERFSIPLWIVFGIFLLLNVLTVARHYGLMALLVCAAGLGAGYILLLKSGYRPGATLSGWTHRFMATFEPDEAHPKNPMRHRRRALKGKRPQPTHPTQEYIDQLLDKINQKGYNSLSADEKDILMKASKDIF